MPVSCAPPQSVDPLRAGAERAARAALHELPEALVLVFDGELRVVRAAGLALERLDDAERCRSGMPLAALLAQEVWRTVEPLLRSALEGETRSREIWTSGRSHCVTVDVGPLGAGAPGAESTYAEPARHGIVVVLDVTARRQEELLASRASGESEERLARAERGALGTGLIDIEGRWLLANRALCEISGYTAQELLGKRFDGIVHPDDVGEDLAQRRRLLAGEARSLSAEKRYFDAAGETVSAIVTTALVRERGGAPRYYVLRLQDVSERRRLEQELRALGDHDPLTGVRNGRLFGHDLKLQVARSHRYGEAAGLLALEIDPLDGVDGREGERLRDEVLEAVSRALARRLRETDLLARTGADQFAVLLPHIDEEGLAVVADSLQRVIAACAVDLGETLLHPSASIGATLVDERTESAEQALARVDRELRAARRVRTGGAL